MSCCILAGIVINEINYRFNTNQVTIKYAIRTISDHYKYSSTLAWKIPWAEEPGRLQSMGSLRVGHD